MDYIQQYLSEAKEILTQINRTHISNMVEGIRQIRDSGGRLFILGVGGGAGHASHAVNDFRKIVGLEAYTPTDNVSELTARINDEGWDTSFSNWLRVSRLSAKDGILVFSVGGGNEEKRVSVNIVLSLKYAKEIGSKIYGIVGRDGGYTAKVANACVIIPSPNKEAVTAHTEAFQAVIWHLIVSHPLLQKFAMKWESINEVK